MTDAMGWTLIHSLWQGSIIALVLALALWLSRRASASVRYGLACIALTLMVAAPLATFLRISGSQRFSVAAVSGLHKASIQQRIPAALMPDVIDPYLSWIAAIWLCGVAVLTLRWTLSWILLTLRSRGAGDNLLQDIASVVDLLRAQLNISKPVRLCAVKWMPSPAVIGWLRPVLLLPASALTGLTPEELHAILAHELAHIRRHDYLVNLIQTAMETLLFYHPAAWWVSRQIRIEREHCCDDIAVAACGDRVTYARALVVLAENRPGTVSLAMAASSGTLKNRIQRVLGGRPSNHAGWPISAVVLGIALLSVWGGQRMAAQASKLSPAYTKWVNEDVVYIIRPEERAAFERLSDDIEAKHFIEQFWQRRNPDPSHPEVNAFRDEIYRRIAYSNELFSQTPLPGWKTDRGRIYIIYGPPDEREVHPIENAEAWRYRYIEGLGNNIVLRFDHGHLK